jgi:hypothetical protein
VEVIVMSINAILPRAAAILAAWLAAEGAKRGLTLDPEELAVLILAVYAAVHRLLSRYLNPGDATKSTLIREDKLALQSRAHTTHAPTRAGTPL